MDPAAHVLIASDEAQVRALIARVIERLSHSIVITEAEDGIAALQAVKRHGADFVITDYDMPRLNGIDLVQKLRERLASIPVLMVSADPTVEHSALDAGVTCFLTKPFHVAQLEQKLVHLGLH